MPLSLFLAVLCVPFMLGMDGDWLPAVNTISTALAAWLGSHSNTKRLERKLMEHQAHDDVRFDAIMKGKQP